MHKPTPHFWANPLRYWRWAARETPALYWSIVIGTAGPVILATVPPIRKRLGYERPPPVPMTYPIPSGPRKTITGYDD
ncbi:NADH-ubiquinone oxidoreductase 9.5 kDa subunit [Hypoxylon crocopeplum]|nr:NADH-ubiquinone oxidoreductase 9.5 kDa subunit [Hypoxylon crocopeplum]